MLHTYMYLILSRMRERECQLPRITRKEAEGLSEYYTLISEHLGLPYLGHMLLPFNFPGMAWSTAGIYVNPEMSTSLLRPRDSALCNKGLYTMFCED